MPPATAKMSRRQKSSARDAAAAKKAAGIRQLPAVFLGLSVIATAISQTELARNETVYRVFTVLLSASVVLPGLAHFYPPLLPLYKSMVFIPFPEFWIYATGAALVASGVGLLSERWRSESATAVVYTLIVVLPGNVACVFLKKPRDMVAGGSRALALARLPLQATWIAWAMWIAFGY
jgi:uncharacterized membrane protein